jgi:hypothetical protein
VTHHATGKERSRISSELNYEWVRRVRERYYDDQGSQDRKQGMKDLTAIPAITFKTQDKREKIQTQFENPLEGSYTHV